MPKKKNEEEKGEEVLTEQTEAHSEPEVVQPITQEFSNGDLNILRNKINEIIARG